MTDNWDWSFECPSCHTEDMVAPSGLKSSKILIIGSQPGKEEVRAGKPMVGAMGSIMRSEFARHGVNILQLRKTNLWLHIPNKNEDCKQAGAEQAIMEAKGKQAILLIGAETVSYFCDKSVSKVNGLLVKSIYLSAPVIMACMQPAKDFYSGGIGEVRLTISKFCTLIEDML
jgi:uracil-DNA glycosylase family 4